MRVIGDKNQISEDVLDFMISYLPFNQKSIRSELAKLFSISILEWVENIEGEMKKGLPTTFSPFPTWLSTGLLLWVVNTWICEVRG